MYVKACKIYNEGDAPMLRHDLSFTYPDGSGWLITKDALDKRTGRQVKRAWLLDETRTKNLFPPLYYIDIEIDNGTLHIRGEERDPLSGKLTAMAWYCEVIGGRRHGQDPAARCPLDN